jgi:hypothetical protein
MAIGRQGGELEDYAIKVCDWLRLPRSLRRWAFQLLSMSRDRNRSAV